MFGEAGRRVFHFRRVSIKRRAWLLMAADDILLTHMPPDDVTRQLGSRRLLLTGLRAKLDSAERLSAVG